MKQGYRDERRFCKIILVGFYWKMTEIVLNIGGHRVHRAYVKERAKRQFYYRSERVPPRDSPKILYGCLSNEGRCTLSSENRRYGVYQGKKGKGSADMPGGCGSPRKKGKDDRIHRNA